MKISPQNLIEISPQVLSGITGALKERDTNADGLLQASEVSLDWSDKDFQALAKLIDKQVKKGGRETTTGFLNALFRDRADIALKLEGALKKNPYFEINLETSSLVVAGKEIKIDSKGSALISAEDLSKLGMVLATYQPFLDLFSSGIKLDDSSVAEESLKIVVHDEANWKVFSNDAPISSLYSYNENTIHLQAAFEMNTFLYMLHLALDDFLFAEQKGDIESLSNHIDNSPVQSDSRIRQACQIDDLSSFRKLSQQEVKGNLQSYEQQTLEGYRAQISKNGALSYEICEGNPSATATFRYSTSDGHLSDLFRLVRSVLHSPLSKGIDKVNAAIELVDVIQSTDTELATIALKILFDDFVKNPDVTDTGKEKLFKYVLGTITNPKTPHLVLLQSVDFLFKVHDYLENMTTDVYSFNAFNLSYSVDDWIAQYGLMSDDRKVREDALTRVMNGAARYHDVVRSFSKWAFLGEGEEMQMVIIDEIYQMIGLENLDDEIKASLCKEAHDLLVSEVKIIRDYAFDKFLTVDFLNHAGPNIANQKEITGALIASGQWLNGEGSKKAREQLISLKRKFGESDLSSSLQILINLGGKASLDDDDDDE